MRPGLKTGVKNDILGSGIGAGFGVPGGTPPPRFPRSIPPPPLEQNICETSCTFLLTVLLSLFPLPLAQCRVQNSLYFCVFKYAARAVKPLKGLEPGRKLGIDAKNFRFHWFNLYNYAKPNLRRKKNTVLQSIYVQCCSKLKYFNCAINCFVVFPTFPTTFVQDYCRLPSEKFKAH